MSLETSPRPDSLLPPLSLRLIGQMQAWVPGGRTVLPIGRKTRALLAILALSTPRPVSRSRLADLLWSRRQDEQARASMRQELHRLLEALQPVGVKVLSISRDYLTLQPDLVWIDVQEVARATAATPESLALINGELLEEFDGLDPALDQFLAQERERLRDRARAVAEAFLDEQADTALAVPAAQQLLTIDRSHEGAWRALMHGYAARGERVKAIQAYEQCREVLTDSLHAAPSSETQKLAADIRLETPAMADGGSMVPKAGHRAVRGGPTLAVMPLQPLTPGDEERQLSVSLADSITAALARFRSLLLVGAASLPPAGTGTVIHADHGVDLLLQGSVQKSSGRLRVNLRMLDLRENEQVVWATQRDHGVEEMLFQADEFAGEVASQVELETLRNEGRRAGRRDGSGATAHDLVASAVPLIARVHHGDSKAAGRLLDRALQREPDHAAAHAWTAYLLLVCAVQGWAGRRGDVIAAAAAYAERAVMLDPQDARGLTVAGHVRALLHCRPVEALELHGQAVSMNPNLAMAWGLSAAAHAYLGDFDEATRRFGRFRRLAETQPNVLFIDSSMVLVDLLRRDCQAAVDSGRRATELNPQFLDGLKHYLAALGHAGRPECPVVRDRVMVLEPRFSVQAFIGFNPLQRAADREFYAEGLRLAGVPEGETAPVPRTFGTVLPLAWSSLAELFS